MWWMLLTTVVQAQVETTETETIPVLYSGLDEQASLLRVSRASKRPIDTLTAKTIIDISQNAPITVLENNNGTTAHLEINTCPGEAVSNIHIRKLTQKADNYLNYYELEKASQTLKQAEDIMVCLKELFNADDVRQLYFIRGILEQNIGNNTASVRAFSSAIRIKPDMQWNDMYSPDARPNFEQAKRNFVNLNAIPLDISPINARSDLWINGSPLLADESPVIFEGRNIIQIIGLDTQTYELDISADATSIHLLAPSTVPADAHQWVQEPEGQDVLSTLLPTILPTDSTLYIQDRGRVWETNIGTEDWTELSVPKYAELQLNAKQTTIRTVFWGGLATSATYFGLAMEHYAEGYGAHSKTLQPQSWDDYTQNAKILEEQRGYYRSDLIRMGFGLAVAGLSYRWAY